MNKTIRDKTRPASNVVFRIHSFLIRILFFPVQAEYSLFQPAESIFSIFFKLRIYHDTFYSLVHIFCAVYVTYVLHILFIELC